jgi:uncharacterized alpha-E superfamily protein
MANHLGRLAKIYDHETLAQTAVCALMAELETQTTDRIFDEGLHEFLTRFVGQAAALGAVIHDSYLSGDMAL